MALCPDDCDISLLHILRKPTATEELMGKKFTAEQPARFGALLEKAKERLIECGYHPKKIETLLVTDPYPTVSEAIIDQCRRRHFDMVIIGRKRMTKAEEFVMGDVSVKLLREMEKMAILVVRAE
jgi:nucleotide-binding universal stress UspA family protein